MGEILPTVTQRTYYNCLDCPAYCCSIYERVQVTPRDIRRLAKHFNLTEEMAKARFTKQYNEKEQVLRRKADPIFGKACHFLNPETRACTIYHARPAVCRQFPDTTRCAYYDLLKFERQQQGDPDALPLVKITFKSSKRK
jgi:Fe-S-cluster containining protein